VRKRWRWAVGEHWPWAVIGLVVAAIVAVIVVKIVNTNEPLSVGEAKEAFEGLPYPVKVRETGDHVLIGEVIGRKVVLHFAAAESFDAPGIPPRLRRLDREADGGGNFSVWDDSKFWGQHGGRYQSDEANRIAVELDEALCRKETGEACPV
jgi:hypothetical protein